MSVRVGLLVGMLFASFQIQAAAVVEGEMIVRLNKGVSAQQFELSVLDADGAGSVEIVEPLIPDLDLYLVRVSPGANTRAAFSALGTNRMVKYAQPNHVITRRESNVPNDAMFKQQWGLANPAGNGADIKALDAWKLGTGGLDRLNNEIVVAVVDGGIDVKHQDLADNVWYNKGEVAGNGKDDDGNGYIDDINGWNAFNSTGNLPPDTHATHVAGIVGATGNNGKQVTGVNWKVKIMSIAGASGNTATVAKAYGYVAAQKKLYLESKGAKGAFVVSTNSSFGVDYGDCSSATYKAWNDMYDYMGSLGILSAAATANLNIDVDVKGDVPTGCASPYMFAVTNTTSTDAKNSSAGYGKKTIDIGAPGTAILATLPNNQTGNLTGTSMATPHIAGAIGLLHSLASKEFATMSVQKPGQAALMLKDAMIKSVDVIPSLKDVTVSGGRLNLAKAAASISRFKAKK
ncbi:MAG: S8 family serine peptidase [Bdellovibrionia bacterium]